MNASEWERIKTVALAHIQRKPGLSWDRLAAATGLQISVKKRNGTVSAKGTQIKRLINELQAEGLAEVWFDRFDTKRLCPKLYPPGYQQRPLFQPAAVKRVDLRMSRDEPRPFTEQPQPKPSQHQENSMPRNIAAIEAEIDAAIAQLQATGQPFKQTDILKIIRKGNAFLVRYPELRARINEATAASRSAATPKAVRSSDGIERVAELERQVADLEARNRELRSQLGEQPDLTGMIRDQIAMKTESIEILRQEKAVIEAKLSQQLTMLEALQQLLKSESESQPQFQMIASANGNGHKICA